jgi:hypothetical protein
MCTIQSINGKEECGVSLRNGLLLAAENPEAANQRIIVNGEDTSLREILGDIIESKIPINPIIDIMNGTNLALFTQQFDIENENELKEKYMLSSLSFSDLKQEHLKKIIFDIALQQSNEEIDIAVQPILRRPIMNLLPLSETDVMAEIIIGIIVTCGLLYLATREKNSPRAKRA